MNLLLCIQVLLAGLLGWSCFCRLQKTGRSTRADVRWAIWFLGVAAGSVLLAPVAPLLWHGIDWPAWTTPLWTWLLLLLAATLVQIITARHWRGGVPRNFMKEG